MISKSLGTFMATGKMGMGILNGKVDYFWRLSPISVKIFHLTPKFTDFLADSIDLMFKLKKKLKAGKFEVEHSTY